MADGRLKRGAVRRGLRAGLAVAALLAGGCGSQPPRVVDGERPVTPARPVAEYVDPGASYGIDAVDDPWEGMNRRIYAFNARFDRAVMLPLVNGYRRVTPDYVEARVGDFLANVADLGNLANALLQLKVERSLKTTFRLASNSTLGVLGLWDVADAWWGVPAQREDFGQTLGHYGVATGPYLVLPFLGPSNLRDAAGFATDRALFNALDPLALSRHDARRAAYLLLNAIDTRKRIGFRYYESGSPFEYELVRNVVTRARELQIER